MGKRKKILTVLLGVVLCSTMINYMLTPAYATEIWNAEEPEGMEMTDMEKEQKVRLDTAIKTADKIANIHKNENIMFSPTSLNFALGMLEEGAKGETKDALSGYLNTGNYSDFAKQYMQSIQDYSNYGENYGYKTELSIANAIWTDEDIELKKEFQNAAKNKFTASVENLDFSDRDQSCKAINDWCDEKTNHLIPEIVTPDSLPESTGMCLTNSLYFECGWAGEPWDVETEEDDFGSEGEKTTYMTSTSEDDAYYENEKANAFSHAYANGLQFIGILPKEDGDFTLEELDIPGLIKTKPEYTEVYARMPKLNFTTSSDLTGILSDSGLQNIFSDNADFSGISDSQLAVGSILQKTNIQLDENGTKAAAVTAALMRCMALMPGDDVVKEVNLNRPFAFMIYDMRNDEPLFIGKITTSEMNNQ